MPAPFPMMYRGNMSGVDMQNLPLALRYQQMRGGFGPSAAPPPMPGMAPKSPMPMPSAPPPDPFQAPQMLPTQPMPMPKRSDPMPPPQAAQFDPTSGDWTPGPGGFPTQKPNIMAEIQKLMSGGGNGMPSPAPFQPPAMAQGGK